MLNQKFLKCNFYLAGEDYQDTGQQVLVFPNSSSSGRELCHNITIINDMLVEFNETFTIILSSSDSAVRFTNTQSLVTIIDDEINSKSQIFMVL